MVQAAGLTSYCNYLSKKKKAYLVITFFFLISLGFWGYIWRAEISKKNKNKKEFSFIA